MIKNALIDLFNGFHETGKFVRELNATFLLLIPKVVGATNIRDFRFVSLVDYIYKLIAKVFVRKWLR